MDTSQQPKSDPSEDTAPSVSSAPTRKQDEITNEINDLNKNIAKYSELRNAGMLNKEDTEKLKKSKATLTMKEKKLKRLQCEAERQRARRKELQSKLKTIAESNPEINKFCREKPGKPSLNTDQPELLKVICDIASAGASADERRRTERLRACKTLNDLTSAVNDLGYNISRSATYLRLQPRRSDTQEGKRHVTTVPVKLTKASNTQRKKHADANFAFASFGYVHEICSWFGPEVVSFISVDDKARVPLGITAAKSQAPIVMHMDYKIRLPDHDFAIAERHKLIPSVYAACEIKPNTFKDALTYSGPTYIAIRSGKHDTSNAFTHAQDFEHLLTLPSFESCVKDTVTGQVKPIVIVSVDGGPDENPRFPKTLSVAVDRFKTHDLDVYVAITHAPGYSAYNRVERRMAPLSRELSGLILPHDSYGTHLNSGGKTIDHDLEKANFQKAGETLANIWSNVIIDSHPVECQFVGNENSQRITPEPNDEWVAGHVRQSQYILQIAKCRDINCCGEWRTNWFTLFPSRFLPAPYPIKQTKKGMKVPEPEEITNPQDASFATLSQRMTLEKLAPNSAKNPLFKNEVPYDLFCPKVSNEITRRVCKTCGIYFPSAAAMKRHASSLKGRHHERNDQASTDEIDLSTSENVKNAQASTDEIDLSTSENVKNDPEADTSELPVYTDVSQFLVSPWTEIQD